MKKTDKFKGLFLKAGEFIKTKKDDEKEKNGKEKDSGKNAPHGTDEENHHRQNHQRGQNTA